MDAPLENQVEQLRSQGPRQFANWNAEAFDSFVAGPVTRLQHVLPWYDKNAPDLDSLANYLRLVFEGVGAGWLRVLQPELPPPTFLAHCLTYLVPNKLGDIPRGERGEVLRKVWNLGEGLAREPQWLNQYAIARCDWSTALSSLDRHLAEMLAPVLSPLPPASWNGAYRLHRIDLRPHADAFVPGRLYLASPAVLCIENRLNSHETLAMLLQKSGGSEVLGPVAPLPEHREAFEPPAIKTTPDALSIHGSQVDVPLLGSPRDVLAVASGFVVVSADDSQRLWLVEAE
ncbi:MAG: hypothetical protein RIC55_03570 [Pirellulaceae bacterium]